MNEFNLYSSDNPYYTDPLKDEEFEVEIAQANAESNVFFVNESGRLQDRSAGRGLDVVMNARSAVYLDFDRDGFLDIAINNYHGPVMVFKNQRGSAGRNRLEIQLEGDPDKRVTRDAIGAIIEVHYGGDEGGERRSAWREIHSTIGYLSGHPKEQHIGVGDAKKATVIVRWPDGSKQQFENVTSGMRYRLRQGGEMRLVP